MVEPLKFEGDMRSNWKAFKILYELHSHAKNLQSKISEAARIEIFLKEIGDEASSIYIISDEIKPFKKLTEAESFFEDYCKSANTLENRVTFYNCNQESTESFTAYIKKLKRIAGRCAFKSQKNDMIQDRLLLGLNNEDLKALCFKVRAKNLNHAIKICRNYYKKQPQPTTTTNQQINGRS